MAPDRDSVKKDEAWFNINADISVKADHNYNYDFCHEKVDNEWGVKRKRGRPEQSCPSFFRGLSVRELWARYRQKRCFMVFCTTWLLISAAAFLFNVYNVDWSKVSLSLGILFVVVTTLLHVNIFESVLIAAAAVLVGGHRRVIGTAPFHHLSLLINYNILAVFHEDIDETMDTMFRAYMGNLSYKVACVMVSATTSPLLKQYELECRDKYRKLIYDNLYAEGLNFVQGKYHLVNGLRINNIWNHHSHLPATVFIDQQLPRICQQFSDNFMVIHRVSRVLKKCGQYQDLMLLSEGDNQAFSYTDVGLYGKLARSYGEPLFHESLDVQRIIGRRFDYTLVLDGDTFVPEGHCFELLSIAAAYPDQGIIQPDIRIVTKLEDTVFMRIECMRQHLSGPTTNAMTSMLGQVSFFGKGLIKNRIYVDCIIGSRERPLELVPIDVLSHDTYEAACLKPFYAGSVYLVEDPCRNYITWNIRETRWNTGDIILAVHFWPRTFGRVVRHLQRFFQKDNYNPIRVRTIPDFDLISSYIAHSAIRHMAMKMFLFAYLLLRTVIYLRNPNWPDLNVTFFILLFPKFAVFNGKNLKLIAIEIFISFLQFSPDIFAGVIRVFVALRSILHSTPRWIPQRAIEEQFQKSNNFLLSFRELWLITICALMLCFVTLTQSYTKTSLLLTKDYLIFIVTALILPFYCGFTSSRVGPTTERILQ